MKIRLLFDCYGCAKEKTLIVSDLHLGYDAAMGFRRQTSLDNMLNTLEQKSQVFERLIILGDVKHELCKIDFQVKKFFERLSDLYESIKVIKGNHDGNLDRIDIPNVKIYPSSGFYERATYFFHGNAYPRREFFASKYCLMGHLHPVVFENGVYNRCWYVIDDFEFNSESKFMKKMSLENAKLERLIIVPSFNPLVEGKSDSYEKSSVLKNIFKYIRINIYSLNGLAAIKRVRLV